MAENNTNKKNKSNKSSDETELSPILITPKHLSSIKKISIAYAKLRQSKEVMPQDLQRAKEIYEFELEEIKYPEIDKLEEELD